MTTSQHTARVGFIGLGDQGAPLAQAIGDSGFGLHVWARRPQSLDSLAQTRHTVHGSPATLAAAVDILELCLRDDRDDRDIWEVLGGPGRGRCPAPWPDRRQPRHRRPGREP